MSAAAGGGGGGGRGKCDHCGKEGDMKLCSMCHTWVLVLFRVYADAVMRSVHVLGSGDPSLVDILRVVAHVFFLQVWSPTKESLE